jgi:hypothetical protein
MIRRVLHLPLPPACWSRNSRSFGGCPEHDVNQAFALMKSAIFGAMISRHRLPAKMP